VGVQVERGTEDEAAALLEAFLERHARGVQL
jgi:hypothetical protein